MTCDPENPAPPVELWTRARADYLAGHSAPVVAERYGLSERTVRRRATVEGWRRADGPSGDAGPDFWSSRSREKRIEQFPQLEEVEQVTFAARFELLVDPDQKNLRRFAFRQAAEAAAMSRPAEAVVWMRLVQTLERTGDRIDREAGRFHEQDYIRAACLQAADALHDPAFPDRED
jgi:hypothetical protein